MIRMSDSEVAEFLASERVLTCATAGPRGWPHLMPLWYVLREPPDEGPGPRLWAWTYAASQKVRNIERDPRATLLIEAGEAYAELREHYRALYPAMRSVIGGAHERLR